jgi:hypothetical protein
MNEYQARLRGDRKRRDSHEGKYYTISEEYIQQRCFPVRIPITREHLVAPGCTIVLDPQRQCKTEYEELKQD